MALSIEASQIFPQASRNVDASVIFRRIDLMQLPEFMRSTTLRWTFLVAGIFAAFIVALLGFIYLKTESDLTTRSDRVIASQMSVFAGLSPERRLDAINEHLKQDPSRVQLAGLFSSSGRRIAGNLESLPSDLSSVAAALTRVPQARAAGSTKGETQCLTREKRPTA
jgi:hypothetical protein